MIAVVGIAFYGVNENDQGVYRAIIALLAGTAVAEN
jgi:hypothetical protein